MTCASFSKSFVLVPQDFEDQLSSIEANDFTKDKGRMYYYCSVLRIYNVAMIVLASFFAFLTLLCVVGFLIVMPLLFMFLPVILIALWELIIIIIWIILIVYTVLFVFIWVNLAFCLFFWFLSYLGLLIPTLCNLFGYWKSPSVQLDFLEEIKQSQLLNIAISCKCFHYESNSKKPVVTHEETRIFNFDSSMTNTYPGYDSFKKFCLARTVVQLKLDRRVYFGDQETLEAYMKLKEQMKYDNEKRDTCFTMTCEPIFSGDNELLKKESQKIVVVNKGAVSNGRIPWFMHPFAYGLLSVLVCAYPLQIHVEKVSAKGTLKLFSIVYLSKSSIPPEVQQKQDQQNENVINNNLKDDKDENIPDTSLTQQKQENNLSMTNYQKNEFSKNDQHQSQHDDNTIAFDNKSSNKDEIIQIEPQI